MKTPAAYEQDADRIMTDGNGSSSKQEAASKEAAGNDAPPHKTIEGAAVDVTARNRLLVLGTGFVGGVVGAALVGAGLYFYPPESGRGLEEKVSALSVALEELDVRLGRETGGAYARLAMVEEHVRRHGDQIGTEPIADRLQALQSYAAQVQEDMANLEDQVAVLDVEGVASSLEALEGLLSGLGARISVLEDGQLPADLPDRVGQMAQGLNAAAEQINSLALKLGALEEEVARPDPSAQAALGIAIANLARAVDAGTPFVAELEAIAALTPKDPAVAELLDVAPKGVRSFAALKLQFADLVDPLLVAERQAGRETYWDRFVGNVLSVVTVRRVGDVEGDSVEAIVARAETRLGLEDLPGAVVEVQALSGAAADVAAPWLAQADARVSAERLVRELSARVLSALASGGE
jgi:hypothetical protein